MKPSKLLLFAVTVLSLAGCKSEDSVTEPTPSGYVVGKNRFTTQVDGDTREYFVHVPASYSGNTAVPVVFMFHGSGQSGEQFYNISGWKEVGESQNLLTVFPSSLSYCIIEDGVTKTETKWAEYSGGIQFCAGVVAKDDMKFARTMITELKSKFNVDAKRIYAVGFSNGGKFSARCAVELSDIFAATVSSGGGGALPNDTTFTPVRLLPTLLQFGTIDGKLLKNLGVAGPLPMNFTTLFSTYPGLYGSMPKPFIDAFKENPATYVVSGDSTVYLAADYAGLSGNPNNVFRLVEVKGLEHEYPNGINHPLKGAELHWAWMKNYTLP